MGYFRIIIERGHFRVRLIFIPYPNTWGNVDADLYRHMTQQHYTELNIVIITSCLTFDSYACLFLDEVFKEVPTRNVVWLHANPSKQKCCHQKIWKDMSVAKESITEAIECKICHSQAVFPALYIHWSIPQLSSSYPNQRTSI